MWISQSEAAKLPQVKVSKQRINALVTQGRLQTNAKKQVDMKEVLRLFTRDTDPAWDEQSARTGTRPPAPQPDDDDDFDSSTFRDARTKQALITAERQQFELERQKGLYVPRADVDRAMESAGRRLGQQVDTIPHMADELYAAAHSGSSADLRRLLKAKARQIRQALADAMAGQDAQGDDADGA